MITILRVDDWEALYGHDGRLVEQTHSVDVRTILEAMSDELGDCKYSLQWIDEDPRVDEDFMGFPETLKEWDDLAHTP